MPAKPFRIGVKRHQSITAQYLQRNMCCARNALDSNCVHPDTLCVSFLENNAGQYPAPGCKPIQVLLRCSMKQMMQREDRQ
jgi:hypothetical protein